VVVIDRDGVIRLIRVGSGEANARAIGELLETLLAPAGNAADAGVVERTMTRPRGRSPG
jgi:hypothetical protein